jgi:hypothetical protein
MILCRVLGYPYTYTHGPPHLTTEVTTSIQRKRLCGSLLEDLSYYLSTMASFTLIKLFSEMVKFSKIISSKSLKYCEGK